VEEFRPASVVREDTDLAVAFARGDETAVRSLYGRYGRLVFTVALRVLGDRGLADEATQRTFVQAWQAADRFEPGRDFGPWLATIARRAAIDVQRRERRRRVARLDDVPASDDALVSPAPDGEVLEAVWTVRAAVDQLREEEREVVRLQHLEGLTHEEIADRLDLPLGTVKSRSHRAHRRLATRLGHLRDRSRGGGS
jgi:RNA polymerase sigma-70 factor (ECF subfamily)